MSDKQDAIRYAQQAIGTAGMVHARQLVGGETQEDRERVTSGPNVGTFKKGPTQGKPKTMVVGAVERGGRVRADVTPSGSFAIAGRVREYVLPEASLYTDEHPGYDKIGAEFASHDRINHAAKVYVSGDVHTQTIEGFWSLVKRGISGTYHSVSAKYLQGYLNEYAWRYNNRHDDSALFLSLILSAARV